MHSTSTSSGTLLPVILIPHAVFVSVPPPTVGKTQMEKLRQAHAKEKKDALAEFRNFKRSAKGREESIQAILVHA